MMLCIMIVNLAAFILYGVDKRRAICGMYRIPEKVLLGVAVAGGAYGAGLGMYVFRHKTRKTKFRIMVPVCMLLWTVGAISLL